MYLHGVVSLAEVFEAVALKLYNPRCTEALSGESNMIKAKTVVDRGPVTRFRVILDCSSERF